MFNKYKFGLFIISILSIILTHEGDKTINFKKIEKATFGAGCFWCIEAVFERLDGVIEVEAGYTGGEIKNPTYEQVCSGNTGHAEVIQIVFDSTVISYSSLLDIFWKVHDPTTLNRQGADIGTQYRSVIFYHNELQRVIAESSLKSIDTLGIYDNPVVTELSPIKLYYSAEEYHQDYFRLNPEAAYCKLVIQPKLDKVFNNKK